MEKLENGRRLIIAEAEKRFRKDVNRIEKHLLTAPSKEKYIQLEKEIVYKILHKEPDYHDCVIAIKGGFRERYFKIRRGVSYPLEFIEEIRRHYDMYLTGGSVNFAGESLTITEVLDEPVREWIKGEDGRHVFGEPKFTIEWPRGEAIIEAVKFFMLEEWLQVPIKKPDIKGGIHLLNIPTKAQPDEILNFWFKLQGDNEKGQPYWESEQEIVHFVNQNFKGFAGVSEVRRFTPNMNKSELNQVVWTFFDTYKVSKGKKQYEQLLLRNFTRFEGDKNIYGNIKDYNIQHLKKLFK